MIQGPLSTGYTRMPMLAAVVGKHHDVVVEVPEPNPLHVTVNRARNWLALPCWLYNKLR